MFFPKLHLKAPVRHVSLLVLGAILSTLAYAQTPAQSPLLTKAGLGVSPNIMLTVDDSGSMAFRHMPETVFAGDTFSTANPVGSNTVRWDPNDDYQISTNFMGTVPGDATASSYVLRALRSPDTNTLFYNPEVQYLPWANDDGLTRMSNSPPAKAYKDPLIQTGSSGTFVNLTAYVAPGSSSNWCYSAANTTGCSSVNNGSSSLKHDPGVYFRLQKTGSAYKSITTAANYTPITTNAAGGTNYTGLVITVPGTTSYYTKYAKRADCLTTVLVGGSPTGVCSQTEERQNYANWFSYYRTRNLMARGAMMEAFYTSTNSFRLGWGRINKPSSSSIDGVSTKVIEAGVRDFTSTTKTALFNWLKAMPTSGSTPLPTAMDVVGKYYSRQDTSGPYTDDPSVSSNIVANNKTCRRSYQIMTTDGYWNSTTSGGAGNNDNTDGATIVGTGKSYKYIHSKPYSDGASDTLADFAMKYWKNDLQPNMANNVAPVGDNVSFWQNMTNFTVGLGVRGQLNPATDLPALVDGTKSWPAAGPSATTANVDDLWHAALNSRGQYFSAKDPTELATAIKSALDLSAGGSGTTAGVATASTVLDNTNRKYVPTYIAGEWSGDITAQPLDVNGQALSAVWNAASKWPVKPTVAGGTDWNQRQIFTWDAGLATPQAVPFTWAGISSANQTALGSLAATDGVSFVNFLRGDHSKEGVGNPYRSRITGGGTPFVLGDFINSNPVYIQSSVDLNYGGLTTGGSTYQAYLTAKAARLGVLFVGGNDGMLHAFKDSKSSTAGSTDGQEVFAYVPRTVYPNLADLMSKVYGAGTTVPHRYFVDGWQRETDAYVKAPGASSATWRNYLMGSLGAGGRAIYALDVTDTSNLGASTIRWELSSANDGDLGYVMSPIEVGVLPNGKWVAIFGNGQASTSGNAVLFVVDLETAAITKLTVDSSGSNGLGGVGILKNSVGEITRLYAGDLKGSMWRMDYDATAASKFKVWQQSGAATALFKATNALGGTQPITQAPVLYTHSLGGSLLVFGTGNLFSTADAADVSRQAMYGVWDKDPDTAILRSLSRSNLEARTVSQQTGTGSSVYYTLAGVAVDWTSKRGWVVDLQLTGTDIPGLRVIYPPQAVSFETALISTVAPAQTVLVCDNSSGSGINFLIDVEQGADPAFKVFDTNGDGVVNASDKSASGYATTADGIDSIVFSPAKTGSNAVADGGCAAGFYRVSIQNTSGQVMTCIRRTPDPVGGPATMKDRVQRRIINPPIR